MLLFGVDVVLLLDVGVELLVGNGVLVLESLVEHHLWHLRAHNIPRTMVRE